MKEKWDKIIKLLNEYEEDKIKTTKGLDIMYIWKYEGTLHYYDNYKDENIFDNVRFLIISKEYGFIKWLVDNDKIDLLRLDNRIALSEFNKVERVLMALSIQDNPIEFLVSILK